VQYGVIVDHVFNVLMFWGQGAKPLAHDLT